MRAVLGRLGFRMEGILRSIGAFTDGTRVDGAMHAVLREERHGMNRGGAR